MTHFDLLDDPFDQIILSIPSPYRISSSPCRFTQTIKRKTTKYKDYLANLVTIYDFPIDELTMIHEALIVLEGEHWKEAMESKYVSLLKNQTWRLKLLPPNQSCVSCKWVLKRKYHLDGIISGYKVQPVAHGFTQIQGIDYGETFSPLVKITSLKIMIAHNFHFHQMDMKKTLLNGTFNEEITCLSQKALFMGPNSLRCTKILSQCHLFF
jgi:hypothetical protein